MVMGKTRGAILLLNVIVWLFLLVTFWVSFDSQNLPENWAGIISISALVLLVMQIVEMYYLKISANSFVFCFVVLQFLFLYGRLILFWLDLDQYISWHLFNRYLHINIYHAGLFALAFSQGVFVGFLINRPKNINSNKEIETKEKRYSGAGMAFSGIVVMVVSLPFLISYSMKTIAVQSLGSYVASADNLTGVTTALSQGFFAGVLLLICSPNLSKKMVRFIAVSYFAFGTIYMILSGDRRQIVIAFIVLILCYIRVFHVKLKVRHIVPILLVGFSLLNLLTAIRIVRSGGITVDEVLAQFLRQLGEENIFIQVLGEFGATLFSLVNVFTHYPGKFNWVMGGTYVAGILTLVPVVFSRVFPNLFSAASITANMKATDGNPCGGSLGQDLYANFGSVGVIFSPVLGWGLSQLVKDYENPTSIDVCKYYVRFYILLNCVRAGFYEMTRTYVYVLILMELTFMLFRTITSRRQHNFK